MKAERRHELQTNTLAQFLADLPLYIRFHANKILLGVIVICLVILLLRYRSTQAQKQAAQTREALSEARLTIAQLAVADRFRGNDAERAEYRKRLAQQASSSIDLILATTQDPDDAAIRAEALVIRGDLNWSLANLPVLPGASTQPLLALPRTSEEYLQAAEDAYQQVLASYPSQQMARVTALLGLAAIEENRGNWEQASRYYQQVAADETIASSFRQIAQMRQSIIPQIRMPVYLGSYPATQPSTQATAPLPATAPGPATQPTTDAL
jgi:tetratricopeptide (TPR) repeat protein